MSADAALEVLAVLATLRLMYALVVGVRWAFRHELGPDGLGCGWSGCQSCSSARAAVRVG